MIGQRKEWKQVAWKKKGIETSCAWRKKVMEASWACSKEQYRLGQLKEVHKLLLFVHVLATDF